MNYAAHYERLVSRARSRGLVGHVERHHVVPRCMGGGDEQANIVRLTPEEHFVAHQLLVRMHPGVVGLVQAAVLMARACPNHRAYGWLRRRLAQRMRGIPKSAEHRAKLSAALEGRKYGPNSAEHNLRIAAAKRGNKSRLGIPHRQETREKIRAARLRFWAARKADLTVSGR